MKYFILLATIFTIMAIPPVSDLHAQDLSKGARVYSDNCGRCHNPRAPGEFTDQAWSVIVHHMHTRGYLTANDTAAVLAFLRASNGNAVEMPPRKTRSSASVDAESLITRKGCKGCHIIKGEGGKIGPSLDTVFQRKDDAFIKAKLANPKVDNPKSIMPQMGLTEREKEAILAYLHSLKD